MHVLLFNYNTHLFSEKKCFTSKYTCILTNGKNHRKNQPMNVVVLNGIIFFTIITFGLTFGYL